MASASSASPRVKARPATPCPGAHVRCTLRATRMCPAPACIAIDSLRWSGVLGATLWACCPSLLFFIPAAPNRFACSVSFAPVPSCLPFQASDRDQPARCAPPAFFPAAPIPAAGPPPHPHSPRTRPPPHPPGPFPSPAASPTRRVSPPPSTRPPDPRLLLLAAAVASSAFACGSPASPTGPVSLRR